MSHLNGPKWIAGSQSAVRRPTPNKRITVGKGDTAPNPVAALEAKVASAGLKGPYHG